jgi:predicted MFS family arabinose efflux permease
MTGPMVLLFAAACGLAVSNLYYAQPLLADIADTFGTGSAATGLVVTATQVGYAAGLLFLVPLGDLRDRRRLVPGLLLLGVAGLVGMALAPSLGALEGLAVVVGLASVAAQVLVPFAASLAGPARGGRVVGQVMSGLLIGILGARTVAGLVAEPLGWRAVYGLSAGLMLAMAVLLWRRLPTVPAPSTLPYPALLRSVVALWREEPVLRRRSIYGAASFGAFAVFWTSVAFLLAGPPYGWGEAAIGLLGLVGIAGAVCATVAGRMADHGLAHPAGGAWLALMLVSFAPIALGSRSIAALIVGVVLMDMGCQGIHITNQSQIYRLRPDARSRLTTAYMGVYFAGGGIGSASSAAVYAAAGWSGVSALGAGFVAIALALWVGEDRVRRRGGRGAAP